MPDAEVLASATYAEWTTRRAWFTEAAEAAPGGQLSSGVIAPEAGAEASVGMVILASHSVGQAALETN